jgi:hypothetical protein
MKWSRSFRVRHYQHADARDQLDGHGGDQQDADDDSLRRGLPGDRNGEGEEPWRHTHRSKNRTKPRFEMTEATT